MMLIKWLSVILTSGLIALSSVAVLTAQTKESDDAAVRRIQASQAKAPKIKYPVVDIRGRQIPEFTYLMVMPDCRSCSDFRKKARSFMESHREHVFLILTPDMKDSDDLLTHNRYYVHQFQQKSIFATIPAGGYQR